MKHTGKLPRAVVGEIQHVVNNALGIIFFALEHDERALKSAELIRDYVKDLGEREEFNSNPFDSEPENQ